ncbi:uncharacterized protein N7484_010487 [Penicillium longicatenatum]|uniref:uncharacterized protein n=1 Tax=Penicillium longicatenatum TaxID=1561947 RepID=UPI0025495A80|nr:uncharacterized protein N7484_010487 [Penicillium longicatenatum]KAJ5630387.1 hypothetical protein N7484_010487 [Penicillium longicatenatum]
MCAGRELWPEANKLICLSQHIGRPPEEIPDEEWNILSLRNATETLQVPSIYSTYFGQVGRQQGLANETLKRTQQNTATSTPPALGLAQREARSFMK